MEKLKPSNSIKYLKKMGISTLTKDDETLVLALGGLQNGISPLQMAGAYATIANDGKYIEPTFYSSIDNITGKTILKSKQKTKQIVSKEVAYILKELLKQPVNGTYGTATYCKIYGVDVAAKTGTSDNDYDRWLCGFTPYYTAVTWYGYDINETIEYNKKNPAGLLWANVMSRIHTGLNSATFKKPDSVYSLNICSKTGKRATTACPNTYTEYFLPNTIPELCNEHSGSALKVNTNNRTNTVEKSVVQDIIKDIDEVDPQQVPITNNTTNTNNNTTTNNTTNKNSNITPDTSNTSITNNTSNTSNTNSTTNTANNITNTEITNSTTSTSESTPVNQTTNTNNVIKENITRSYE